MILNAKGWIGIGLITLASGAISYTIYEHPRSEVVYLKGAQLDSTGSPQATPTPTPVIPQVLIGTTIINVRLATTSAAITKGLSGSAAMGQNEGMLFVFAVSDRYQFWMPDMHFGLDMIWIDANKKIVDITKNAVPLRDITKPVFYKPKALARYVLEVHSGFSDANHITVGQKVEFVAI